MSLVEILDSDIIYNIQYMNEQLLKDLVATAKQDGYDWDIITGKFPELADYDTQLLKDYVATAEQDKYDYEKINAKFSEFDFSAKTNAVVGEGATTPAGTDSASEGGSSESQEEDTLIERTFGKNEFVKHLLKCRKRTKIV